jgi:hypothetical protein
MLSMPTQRQNVSEYTLRTFVFMTPTKQGGQEFESLPAQQRLVSPAPAAIVVNRGLTGAVGVMLEAY